MFCSKCGNTLSPQAKFCVACGAGTGAAKTPARTTPKPSLVPPNIALPPAHTISALPPPGVYRKPKDDLGFRFDNRRVSFGDSFANWSVTPVMLAILAAIIASGYLAARLVSSGIHGVPVSGSYSSPTRAFSLDFPPGWHEAPEAQYRTGYINALGYYFLEGGKQPKIVMKVFYTSADTGIPKHFSRNTLEWIEPSIEQMMKDIKSDEGAEYRMLQLSTYLVNGRDAIWVEGNEIRGSKDTKRDFTFMTFEGHRMYIIEFVMKEEDIEEGWLDIQDILSTMRFHTSQ